MKKLMKAIAFATVMCMLLSTAAFAAGLDADDVVTDYVLNVTVTTTNADEEVALLIVKSDVADLASVTNDAILYVDQKPSVTANDVTTATFSNVSIDSTKGVTTVDIYAGHASAGGAAKVLEDISLTKPVTDLSVSIDPSDFDFIADIEAYVAASNDDNLKNAMANAEAPEVNNFSAVKTVVNVSCPAGNNKAITGMYWAFKLSDGNYKYVKVNDVSALGGSVLSGDVSLAAVFINGAKAGTANEATRPILEVVAADVIFQLDNDTVKSNAISTNPSLIPSAN